MYTCMFLAARNGESCFDPLLLHYPTLEAAFEDPEHTFIYANSLKVSPVLAPNTTTYQSFFPNGDWVSLKDFGDVLQVNNSDGGEWINLTAPNEANDTVNVHLVPGSIITF